MILLGKCWNSRKLVIESVGFMTLRKKNNQKIGRYDNAGANKWIQKI